MNGFGPPSQVGWCQQTGPVARRGVHKARVGHILRPVGKGQTRGLGVKVQPLRVGQALCQWLVCALRGVQQAQNLADCQRAGARWRHTANAQGACRLRHRVVKTQGFAHDCPIGCQIGQRQAAGMGIAMGMRLYLLHQRLRHSSAHQGIRSALGNGLQHGCQFRIAQHMAYRPGLAQGVVKIGQGHRVALE